MTDRYHMYMKFAMSFLIGIVLSIIFNLTVLDKFIMNPKEYYLGKSEPNLRFDEKLDPMILKYGLPSWYYQFLSIWIGNCSFMVKFGYINCYDNVKRIPNWIVEVIYKKLLRYV